MELRDVFEGAKRAIRLHGWSQGSWMDKQGCVCAEGAIHAAILGKPTNVSWPFSLFLVDTDGHEAALEQGRLAMEATFILDGLAEEADPSTQSVMGYNDKAGRTVEDVIALFDQAIEQQAAFA